MYSGLIITLGILLCIGLLATNFATKLNRDLIVFEEKSRNLIRDRIGTFSKRPLNSFVLSCQLSSADSDKALLLIQEMGRVIGCCAEKLTFEMTLGEVLRVTRYELHVDDNISQKLPMYFEPFTHDIIELLMSLSDKHEWKKLYKTGNPRSETELADFIMTLTPAQFLSNFAPIISVDYITRRQN